MSSIKWIERGQSFHAISIDKTKQVSVGWVSNGGEGDSWIMYLYAHFSTINAPAEMLEYHSAAEAKQALEKTVFLHLLTKRMTS